VTRAADLAILYAENDPDDQLLAQMAHRESGATNPLVLVHDGAEAIEYLRQAGRHSDQQGSARPGVVILDLNMPGMGGLAALRIIKADAGLRRIPVVILSTSTARVDIVATYEAGANSYIVKPSTFSGLASLFDRACGYWFEVNTLAPEVSA
jgi:CheY-like chemotaxis protein